MRFRAAFAVLTLLAAPAWAGTPEIRPVFGADGTFSFCLAEQSYDDGRKLTFALSPQGEINIGPMIPHAGFKRGARYDVFLTVGTVQPRKVRGQALDDDTLLLQMGGSAAFKNNLMAAHELLLGAGGNKVYPFALPPMDRLMASLRKCLADRKDSRVAPDLAEAEIEIPAPTMAGTLAPPRPMKTAPVVADEDSPPPPSPSAGALPQGVMDLLTDAFLTPVVPLSLDKVPPQDRPADAIWKMGKVLGGVREREAPVGKRLPDLIGIHMRGLEAKCAGDFRADVDREKRAPALKLRTAEASCAPKKASDGNLVTVGLTFYLTDSGLFTVFTYEGVGEAKAEVLAARDKLAKAILARAEKQAKNGKS